MVLRVYVEKKPGFDVEASQLFAELHDIVGIETLEGLRLVNRYDAEGISPDLFEQCVDCVFSEPQVDDVYSELPWQPTKSTFAVEYLPGQFDQRADSASECIQLISQGERPHVRSAKIYELMGDLSDEDIAAVKHYVINPVEAREASLDELETLEADYPAPADVEILDGFLDLSEEELADFIADRGLAMSVADLVFCQAYFVREGRAPTITEIKMIDTYWSDHCRHTTFATRLDDIDIADANVQKAFERYQEIRHELDRDDKPLCLMDIATAATRYLKATDAVSGIDESEEVNACTIRCTVDVDGQDQDWLYLFKNETHNHPTEIEPFGGAATCVGGAIRDPLAGRSYVYQSMRLTGAADPRTPIADTLPGKLPQRKLVTTAAAGYSSYGNQIGLATGQVHELYHPGYAAKRMEIGAVVGATPADHVRRSIPVAGDVVVLLGGRTGRDGIGGATGSSKAHDATSLESCGAEVQKGNAPVERKIQRLFRRGCACRMIKRCNDFGAGGVSVAIGEVACGLLIELDKVPKKYDGLDGTELALSESQERMAVVLAPEDVEAFLALAHEENLEATPVATVTDDKRVRMVWRGSTIVDVSRDFLSSNGAARTQQVKVTAGSPYVRTWDGNTLEERLRSLVGDINIASNKGLSERFDSTIGAATVLAPFGGTYQLTPSTAMVAKLPVEGTTTTVSGMAWGFNPYLTEADPYVGSYIAVVESVAKLVAAGFLHDKVYLTFQEYFERLRDDPVRWGKPFAALLGAFSAQLDLGVASIGGKDSMSGSFEDLDVPPTLVSFATAIGTLERVTSPEFKCAGHAVVRVFPQRVRQSDGQDSLLPDSTAQKAAFKLVEELIGGGFAQAVSTPGMGACAEALFKMCVGNRIGFSAADAITLDALFEPVYGSFIVELTDNADVDALAARVLTPEEHAALAIETLGHTTKAYEFSCGGQTVSLADVQETWEAAMEGVFPYRTSASERAETAPVEQVSFVMSDASGGATKAHASFKTARPQVVIPVFPGNNCEYDSARAFERAGAKVTTFVINNLSPDAVAQSTNEMVRLINNAQIIMLPGGFSGGDEPDGSAKFITAFFRSPKVTEAVRDLLQNRDGLILGICNGFQALVKLGLVPFGDIISTDATCPTLTFNTIGRHQSRLVRTRVASTLSPWFAKTQVGDIYTVAISHGEGRFVASPKMLEDLAQSGQIATQYVDADGLPSMDLSVNPNGSMMAIEGITSPDGRVLGKMGHSERAGEGLYKNIPVDPRELYQPIFEAGVAYFA